MFERANKKDSHSRELARSFLVRSETKAQVQHMFTFCRNLKPVDPAQRLHSERLLKGIKSQQGPDNGGLVFKVIILSLSVQLFTLSPHTSSMRSFFAQEDGISDCLDMINV